MPADNTPATFCIVRTLGNDLPLIHNPHQTELNLRYTLENNTLPADVTQLFVLNRIVAPDKLEIYCDVLKEYRQPYKIIPFDRKQWASLPVICPQELARLSKEFAEQLMEVRARQQKLKPYLKCLINLNQARNFALDWARREASQEWIVLLDGSCYFNRHQWDDLLKNLKRDSDYLLIPQIQLPTWDRAKPEEPSPPADKALSYEPQLAFHRDRGRLTFNEGIVYGYGDKAELLRVITNRTLLKDPKHPWSKWHDNHTVHGIPDRAPINCRFQLISSVYRLPRWEKRIPRYLNLDAWDPNILPKATAYMRAQSLWDMIAYLQHKAPFK